MDIHASDFEIPVPEEFRYAACLDYLSRSGIECLYEVRADRIVRLLHIGGQQVLIELWCEQDHRLAGRVLRGTLDHAGKMELITWIREWFDLERDLAPFYQMAARNPVLGEMTQRCYGLRLMGIPDLFEALCWAIVGQQVNLTFAYKLKQRLTETYGDAMEHEGVTYRHFPRPEQVANADPEELGALQLTRMKTRAILEVAGRMSRGELTREGLMSLGSFEAAERELLRIKGIGPWTVQYASMRCLRDPRAFPTGDVGLQNAVKERLGLSRKPNVQELQELFREWAGWEAYATFYLWRALY
jgi:DNA-3-methyladenine glycosylase II